MVKLTKIYTRGGDDGKTHLGDGSRVPKSDPMIEALGALDEANAAIGAAIAHMEAKAPLTDLLAALLTRLQQEFFDLGADVSVPFAKDARLRMRPEATTRLEADIDSLNADLPPLTSFVLPGGTQPAAFVHIARGATRRAERCMMGFDANPAALTYINRVSDLLFVIARTLNREAGAEPLWTPGASRT